MNRREFIAAVAAVVLRRSSASASAPEELLLVKTRVFTWDPESLAWSRVTRYGPKLYMDSTPNDWGSRATWYGGPFCEGTAEWNKGEV